MIFIFKVSESMRNLVSRCGEKSKKFCNFYDFCVQLPADLIDFSYCVERIAYCVEKPNWAQILVLLQLRYETFENVQILRQAQDKNIQKLYTNIQKQHTNIQQPNGNIQKY
jgi:hypothetical protein